MPTWLTVQKQVQLAGSKGTSQLEKQLGGLKPQPVWSMNHKILFAQVYNIGFNNMQSHSLEKLCIYFQHSKKKRKKVLLVSLSKNGNKGHSFQVNVLLFSCNVVLWQH